MWTALNNKEKKTKFCWTYTPRIQWSSTSQHHWRQNRRMARQGKAVKNMDDRCEGLDGNYMLCWYQVTGGTSRVVEEENLRTISTFWTEDLMSYMNNKRVTIFFTLGWAKLLNTYLTQDKLFSNLKKPAFFWRWIHHFP